ncbi:Fe-S cluster assembly protein SufD [Pedobacter sp. UYP30]|uniref:Fe-S cluster assembly protein SufD n=1 Tax=Pedobacter sp. UYP30 TaxID=1756400 RepID=UPI003394BA84
MENIDLNYLETKFSRLQASNKQDSLSTIRESGFTTFKQVGLPSYKNEEWKYTKVKSLFKQEFTFLGDEHAPSIGIADVDAIRLPGSEQANELVFLNGKFSPALSTIRSTADELVVLPLNEAAKGEHKELVAEHLNKSSSVIKDGLQALNTSFINEGVFIFVPKNKMVERPVYFYHITNARENYTLSQPRSLLFVSENAKLQVVESYTTLGFLESFTNEVMEIVANTNAILEHYKIQHDVSTANQVNTTHIRQIGKSHVHTFTLTLDGGTVRNNTHIIMETAGNEGHMYGLYLLKGKTHVDNHTLVDNMEPNCFSNEFYKGIMDEQSTGIFSGKIMVRPDAQKTNAYQSNKNILLSNEATINTKPQLEIFADDVKCSHGCTIGQLDEEALFYLRSRGIAKPLATSMLLQAFAADILEQVKLPALRTYVENLVAQRLITN